MFFRGIRFGISCLTRDKLTLFDPSVLRFRVSPFDLDLNFHVNNARFAKLADFGRMDFIFRSGAWRVLYHNKWTVVIGGLSIRFRRSLMPFERFQLLTTVPCWDDRWFYFYHCFTNQKKEIVAVGISRALTKVPSGTISPSEFVRLCGEERPSPECPIWIHQWLDSDNGMARYEPFPSSETKS